MLKTTWQLDDNIITRFEESEKLRAQIVKNYEYDLDKLIIEQILKEHEK